MYLQCIVDLSKGVLRVGTTGAETHFLSEKEVEELSMAQHKQEEVHVHHMCNHYCNNVHNVIMYICNRVHNVNLYT